jgi:hypothetical protein
MNNQSLHSWARRALLTVLCVALASCDSSSTNTSTNNTPSSADSVSGGTDGAGGDTAIQATDDASGTGTLDYQGESNLGACAPNVSDSARYATVGFWKTSDCSGDPVTTNAFPINSTAGCYCWPGNSGENSCDAAAQTVTIVQYNSLTCGAGDDTPTTKTFHVDKCEQDIPPTLYSRVLEMGPCAP